jgi:hypothetical protein
MKHPIFSRATTLNPCFLDRNLERLEIYDDERPGRVTLYKSDGINRVPCRDIAIDSEHFAECLAAWICGSVVSDFRLKNRS